MSIRKVDGDRYLLDVRLPLEGNKRIRRLFNTIEDAISFESIIFSAGMTNTQNHGPSDNRRLRELCDAWWAYYGHTLKNGKVEYRHLIKTIAFLNNPCVQALSNKVIIKHRSDRLSVGIKPSTINRDIHRISGMFSILIKINEFKGENPFKGIDPLPEKNPEMTFLSTREIKNLLRILKGDHRLVALLCLSTGGRWGEVSALARPQLLHGRVIFLETKNGKKRIVPVSPTLENEVLARASSNLFNVNYERFCSEIRSIKPDLPKGQATHVLRHTFASHFMMNGGNIIALQQILGHASIQQTMTYAHLSPDYLQNAVFFNPLKGGIRI